MNGNFANTFPLLSLPRELIEHVFSFLKPKDRMRARVCKELDGIEAESKYYVKEMNLKVDESYAIDGLKRCIQNASFGKIEIQFTDDSDMFKDVFSLIKEFNVDHLIINADSKGRLKIHNELLETSILEKMPITCQSISLTDYNYCEDYSDEIEVDISAEALHEVYKVMMEGSTKLRMFRVVDVASYYPFYSLIGIFVKDDHVRSRIDGVEAYKIDYECDEEESNDLKIFNGNLEMCFKFEYPLVAELILTLHETRESLETAKGKLVDHKINVIRIYE